MQQRTFYLICLLLSPISAEQTTSNQVPSGTNIPTAPINSLLFTDPSPLVAALPQTDFTGHLKYQAEPSQSVPYVAPYYAPQYAQYEQTQQQTPLFQATLQSSVPALLYQNLIAKPFGFLRPQPQYQQYPVGGNNVPTSFQPTNQYNPYYMPQSQFIVNQQQQQQQLHQQQQQLLQQQQQQQLHQQQQQHQQQQNNFNPFEQFNSQSAYYNPYQNFAHGSKNPYTPQGLVSPNYFVQSALTPQQHGTQAFLQQPVPANTIFSSPAQYPGPTYPIFGHSQIQSTQQAFQTPFLVDLARYIYSMPK